MQLPTSKDNPLDIPPTATHLEYSTSRVAIVAPISAVQDFTHMRGQLRFGKWHPSSERFDYHDKGEELKDGVCVMPREHREMKRIVREPDLPPAPRLPKPPQKKPGQPVATATPAAPVAPRQPRQPREKGMTRASVIDALLIEGGRTFEEVVAIVCKQFPKHDAKAITGNIKTRLWWLPNKLGKTPQPFKK